MKKIFIIIFVPGLINAGIINGQLPPDIQSSWTKMHESKTAALNEFNEAKFGMFIHWGLYSQLAAEWNGQRIPGLGEWIMYHARIPKADYGRIAGIFNPVKFNAEQWVLTAKNAGMKYMVITSKHHDGFSMYHTMVSKYNIYDATPFKRDPIDELYHACKKYGLRFGVYYSHIIDWWDGPDGGMLFADRKMTDMEKQNPMNTWDPNTTTRENYLEKKSYPQVKELITKYPDMLQVWFDYWYEGKNDRYCTPEISYNFYKIVYDVAPNCLVSSRIGSGLGDYSAADDNEIPTSTVLNYWETPGTVNNTWGYSKFDNDWKSSEEILFWIADIACKGGNYLLNIGPKADGTFPEQSVKLLNEVGKWMKINGESIYGTHKWIVNREGPSMPVMKGTDTREQTGFKPDFSPEDFWFTTKSDKVYVISFTKPADNICRIKAFSPENPVTKNIKVKSLRMLGYDKSISWKQNNRSLDIQLPADFKYQYGYCVEITI